jgi:hypothetical protein
MRATALGCLILLGARVPAAPSVADPADVRARLDSAVAAQWKAAHLRPEEPADDATFLRRVWLDLAGRVPPPLKSRAFLDDRDPAKRVRLVDSLLASPEFADHWGKGWAQRLTGKRPTLQDKYDGRVLHHYLRDALAANRSYRQVVTEMICAEGLSDTSGPANFLLRYEAKPADLAGAVGKKFLGVTLQCAQCHDHPRADWKKEDFWGVAAFFGRLKLLDSDELTAVLESRRGRLEIPDTAAKPDKDGNVPKKVVLPRLPNGTKPAPRDRRRQTLAAWVTADANPYFARNAVNQVWAQLFGNPLLGPLDRPVPESRRTQARLLDLLAEDFTTGGHDIKRLIRILVLSRVYQLGTGHTPAPGATGDSAAQAERLTKRRVLASFLIRPLSVDQLYQSIAQATGHRGEEEPDTAKKDEDKDEDEEQGDTPVDLLGEPALTVQRALAMLNSAYLHKATQVGARAAVTANGKTPGPAHVEWLFLATLSRRPTAAESALMADLLKGGKGRRGLEDVLWVLLNSTEFNTNH